MTDIRDFLNSKYRHDVNACFKDIVLEIYNFWLKVNQKKIKK